MKFPVFAVFVVWAFTSGLRANALAPQEVKMAAPEALPTATIQNVEIQPNAVVLNGKFDLAQLVVTAKLVDGSACDVTRLASYTLNGESVAEVTKSGQVAPLRAGKALLQVKVADQQANIPVEVKDYVEKQPVDFIRDVNPVMTKLGCSAGTCHGAKEGKFGFKLSLRGYDPLFDVRSLKDDLAGRRLNVASPDDSLMLLKATAGVPHEGGQRTKLGDKQYEILRTWIADGAKLDLKAPRVTGIALSPQDPVVQKTGARQQVRVVASYTDGSTRDVTALAFIESGNSDVAKTDGGGLVDTLRRGEAPLLARYEGNYAATTMTVMGDRDGFEWKQPETWGRIDELVAAKWQRMKIQPSELCTDGEFLRRISLDLTGTPPTAEALRAFLADTAPTREKREAMVDKLVGSPEFIEHFTNKWADMLQVNAKFLGGEGARLFREWIRKEVEANTPYDQFVQKILTASGSNKANPAASYWKILREPAEAMENTTHLFLATRFNCNKCHDHPFERWTQDQYYQLGAYFSQVALDPDPAAGGAKLEGTAVEKARPLYEIVKDAPTGEMVHLRTNKNAPPKFPYPAGDEPKGSRREQLASWVTSAKNRYFAASYANRLWGYLTGAGIIEPLDDIRAGNPPTNPELLEYLSKEFVSHGFDARQVIRTICKSRTYQLSLNTNRWNEDDKINYSHALARRLPAEVLYDSVVKVTGGASRLAGGMHADALPDSGIDLPSGFLATLGRPARESSCECERSSDLRLGSVMALLGGPAIAEVIGDPKNELAKLATAEGEDGKLVGEVFNRVLSRPPTEREVQSTLEAWKQIEVEDAKIGQELEAKEKEQAPLITKAEAARVEAIDVAKKELGRYETEIAPKLAEAEKKRQDETAAAEASVKEYTEKSLQGAQATFEATVPISRTYAEWTPLDWVELKATNGVELQKQEDGSVRATGARPKNTDYTLKADTRLAGITGVLLEVLPVPTEANFGPGRAADGNLVLGEFAVKVGDFGGNPTTEAKLNGAIADFSQANFEVTKAIDGKRGDGNNGWAVAPQFGVPHFAAFKFEKPQGDAEKGVRLRFEMNHPRDGSFAIAGFRIWVTTSEQPLNQGLPKTVVTALKKPAAARTPEDQQAIAAYWQANDPELRKRWQTVGKAGLPLPVDPGVVERRDALAKAELPIRLDAKLVQLRQDVGESKTQAANKRLTGVQDLAWALINTSEFLFNH